MSLNVHRWLKTIPDRNNDYYWHHSPLGNVAVRLVVLIVSNYQVTNLQVISNYCYSSIIDTWQVLLIEEIPLITKIWLP